MKFKFGASDCFNILTYGFPWYTLCIKRMQGLNLVEDQAPPLRELEQKNRKENQETRDINVLTVSHNLINTHLKSLTFTWFTWILYA